MDLGAWIKDKLSTGDQQIFGAASPSIYPVRSNNFGWTQSTVTQNESNVRRDSSAWYHRLDVSNGTNIRAFINGELAVTWTQASVGTNTNVEHFIGGESSRASEHFKGFLSEVYFVDGQALTATDFGLLTHSQILGDLKNTREHLEIMVSELPLMETLPSGKICLVRKRLDTNKLCVF